MRIVFEHCDVLDVALDRPRGAGGAERQQWLLARALARRGHEIAVYSRTGSMEDNAVVEGVRFRHVPGASPIRAWCTIASREHPDWLYKRGADLWLGPLVAAAHWTGTRVAFAAAFDADWDPHRALSRRRWAWPAYRLGLHTADALIGQYSAQAEHLDPVLRERFRVVPSVATTTRPVPPGGYVAWVGVFREVKRPHLVAEVARSAPEIRFVVCGPSSEHRSSKGYSERASEALKACPNVEYRGRIAPGEAQSVLERANALLSTSAGEGFPNTFLQAWGAGVPIVCLGVDPAGAVAAYGGGVVVGSAEDAAIWVRRYVWDRARRDADGSRGRDYVATHHDEEHVVGRLLDALR